MKPELVSASDDLRTRQVRPGLHFGSLRVSDAYDFVDPAQATGAILTVVNSSELPGVVVLDNWIQNTDRNNVGNNLLQTISSTDLKYWMVDFSHALTGPSWNRESLEQNLHSTNMTATLPFIARHVTGVECLARFLTKAEELQPSLIERVLQEIPNSWTIVESERATLLSFLRDRKTLVREMLTSQVGRRNFPNWKP